MPCGPNHEFMLTTMLKQPSSKCFGRSPYVGAFEPCVDLDDPKDPLFWDCSVGECPQILDAVMTKCSTAERAERSACDDSVNVPVNFGPFTWQSATIPTCRWVPPSVAQPELPGEVTESPGVPDARCARPSPKAFFECLYLGWSGLVHDLSDKGRSGWTSGDGNFVWWSFKRNNRLMYVVAGLCIVALVVMFVVGVTLVVRAHALPDHYAEASVAYADRTES